MAKKAAKKRATRKAAPRKKATRKQAPAKRAAPQKTRPRVKYPKLVGLKYLAIRICGPEDCCAVERLINELNARGEDLEGVTWQRVRARVPRDVYEMLRAISLQQPTVGGKPLDLNDDDTEPQPLTGYAGQKERARKRQADQSASGRDIGELPPPADPERRATCERNLRLALETYWPEQFALEWSADHLAAIERAQTTILNGGLFAYAMPRGSGKTTIAECATIWALVNGHRSFVGLIGASATHAKASLEAIKTDLENNELLTADFPEVCLPIQALEGIANRCKGQTCGGERTLIEWTKQHIILPTIAGSKASGSIVKVAGITGAIRGMKHKLADGRTIRPTLAIVDDPQTDKSAASDTQNRDRLAILSKGILKLSGPGQRIAAFMPCTVIQPGDMADQILDREKFPQWNGTRTKLLYDFPDNMELWQQYGEMLREDFRNGDGDGKRATAFYCKHRAAMDAGARVAWEQRFEPWQESALQFAMTEFLLDEEAFYSEYQNDPQVDDESDITLLEVDQIVAKQHLQKRGVLPVDTQSLVAFVDVQERCLYWLVMALGKGFNCWVIDYGAWPDQQVSHFRYRTITKTLRRKYPGTGLEGSLRAGLDGLTQELLVDRVFATEDGTRYSIKRLLVDGGWQTDVVNAFARDCRHPEVMTSFGRYYKAGDRPLIDQATQPGDKLGEYWRMRRSVKARLVYVTFDANYWKTFFHHRLSTALGDAGCLTLPGDRPFRHQMIAEHWRSESVTKVMANERTVFEWKLPPSKPDNHLLDCAAGCCVAASMEGFALFGAQAVAERPGDRKPVRLSELRKQRRAA